MSGDAADRRAAAVSLLRWLGPWTSETAVPPGIRQERVWVRAGRVPGLRGYLQGEPLARPAPWRAAEPTAALEIVRYHPPGPVRAHYLVVPGLHYLGADDPRLDRFCRVLAAAGFVVHCPMLPGHLDLLLTPSTVVDLRVSVDHVLSELPRGTKLTLFSISFGSSPALTVAAERADRIDAVITFGGYADLEASLSFCLDGVMWREGQALQLPRDPLNSPVLFLNTLPYLGLRDTEALERALREAAYRTWGRFEYKVPGARDVLLYELAEKVPRAQREWFLMAVGLRPQAAGRSSLVWLTDGLRAGREELAFARPLERLGARFTTPTVVLHGQSDDVIPWGEAPKLAQALSATARTRLFVTGLFSHTGKERLQAAQVAEELKALYGMIDALSRGGRLAPWV
ncbi:MAG: hypothetical protein KIT72_01695 [Polyangiaceae bacterium]|nr:hypothetical protein [Polyangiaceae bacterium]MCW5789111.1 hypothetical protein [Polyangiaceae bacterium]